MLKVEYPIYSCRRPLYVWSFLDTSLPSKHHSLLASLIYVVQLFYIKNRTSICPSLQLLLSHIILVCLYNYCCIISYSSVCIDTTLPIKTKPSGTLVIESRERPNGTTICLHVSNLYVVLNRNVLWSKSGLYSDNSRWGLVYAF